MAIGDTCSHFDALPIGGVAQPPEKKCKRTLVSSERSDAHPTTEEAQPSSVADLIIPRVLVPIKKALTVSIEAFDPYGNFEDEEFKAVLAYRTYAEWRRTKSLPCLLYTSPSPRDRQKSRMPSSA